MTSSIDSPLSRLRPAPRPGGRTLWLWPQPVPPGFYGKGWSGRVWITTNHLPSVAAANQADRLVLAVEAGGLPPAIAAAFDPELVEAAHRAVEELTGVVEISTLQVDPALAQRLIVDSSIKHGKSSYQISRAPGADRMQIGRRMLGAFLLTLGQALIVSAPLLLFGWKNLVAGLGILFGAGLALSLLWPLPRRKYLVCRLVLSMLSTLIAVMTAWLGFNLGPERLSWLAGCWWLASFWLSFVFMGAQN